MLKKSPWERISWDELISHGFWEATLQQLEKKELPEQPLFIKLKQPAADSTIISPPPR